MKYWIWLSKIPGIGPVLSNRLLEKFGNPREIYYAKEEDLRLVKGINSKHLASIEASKSLEEAKKIIDQCQKENIKILTKENGKYPDKAKNLPDAPGVLYCQGEIKNTEHTVGIVGENNR